MTNELSDFEQLCLSAVLAGEDDVLRRLRAQASVAVVAEREFTGVGFFVEMVVPAEAARLPNAPAFRIDDVVAELEGLQHGAGFVLLVRDGALAMLEGFSYDEQWPQRIERARFSYRPSPRRRVWTSEI